MPEWIGKTIGKVRIEKLLARGGTAEVYLGSHLTLDRPVAVKLLHSYIEEEPIPLERFHREAKVVAGLRHPNIVQIFDFDTIDGHPYIVMEYLRGSTLAAYLRYQHQRKKRVPSEQIARLLQSLTDALDYAHGQGVIHRDVKPSNVLLHNKTEETPLDRPLTNEVDAILTDFGLARVVNTASQTTSGMITGTPAYMSPEQARGDQVDHRTDIYSLGIVLYELLAGRVPFEADSTMTILHMQIHTPPPAIPGISAKVQAVIDRALKKNPDDRYQMSQELAIDFYLSNGMTAQAEIIREAYPATSTPVEDTDKVPVTLPPKPETAETAAENVSKTAPSPPPISQPRIVQESPSRLPKPARSGLWMGIGVGLFSLVLIILLGVGGYRLFLAAPNVPKSNPTLSPVTPSNVNSPVASAVPALPASTGMVEIPAGTYFVGKDPEDEFHAKNQNVTLNSFWIDQYQTTNAQYAQYMTETGTTAPEIWPAEGNQPVRGVTWDQAVTYCSWAKKRLPREAEWEASGRGSGTSPPLYPWGNDATAGGKISSLPEEDTYAVGTLAFNKSPFGVFDLLGNVWEWSGEPYAAGQEGYKFLHGGRFGLPVVDLAYRLGVPPDDTRYVKYTGFRCAADQVQ